MTRAKLEEYFIEGLKMKGASTAGDVNKYVNSAIDIGLAEFWAARPWSFRVMPYEMTISSQVEEYDLPAYYGGFVTVREKESLSGQGLRYLPLEQFDASTPKPDAHAGGYPQRFTVKYDSVAGVWQAKFFPIPESMTIYWEIVRSSDGVAVKDVPEKFIGGLVAIIAKHVALPGSLERSEAIRQSEVILNMLETEDSPFQGYLFRMMDDTDLVVHTERPWL